MGMIPLAKDFYWHSSVKLWRKVDSILVNISLDEETYKKSNVHMELPLGLTYLIPKLTNEGEHWKLIKAPKQ